MKADLSPAINPLSNIFVNMAPPHPGFSNASTQSTVNKLPEGAKTIGNYLLGKNIGQGSFGKVHLGMHIPTSEKVAIKIIDKAKIRPKDESRVKNEIQILKKISHRNIMSLYEIIETKKSLLLVTQFLPNGQLFRHIIKQKKLSEDQACSYFQQIIQAVQYLHQNKIAHRDLKPQNILIDYDRQIKIIDFGLSSFYEKSQLKTFCGSPCYAAPEMIEGKHSYNPMFVDVWSCGVILFAMICGHLPFCDTETNTLFKKILSCNYKIPTHVSPEAKDLISKLLVLSPEKRLELQEIKYHKWFKRVSPTPCYGLNIGERLPLDPEVILRLKSMGIEQRKLKYCIGRNEKSKDVATYFILMKKLVKGGQLIPTYIGSQHFNHRLIIKDQKIVDQHDTESFGEVSLQTPQAPVIPSMSEAKEAMGLFQEWWFANPSEEEIKPIDQSELMLLANSILDIFLPNNQQRKPHITEINEILSASINEHPLKKIVQEKRTDEFYSNKDHAKKRYSMLEEETKAKKIDYKSLQRKTKPISLRTELKRPKVQMYKTISSTLITQKEQQKKTQSVLPFILNKLDHKSRFKIKDINKRYQIYRQFNK